MDDFIEIKVRDNKKKGAAPKMFSSVRLPENFDVYNSDVDIPTFVNLSSNFNFDTTFQVKKEGRKLKESWDKLTLQNEEEKNNQVFGVSLSKILERERKNFQKNYENVENQSNEHSHNDIPLIVTQILEHLRNIGGIKEVGLFRLCGRHSDLISAKQSIDNGVQLNYEFFNGTFSFSLTMEMLI